MCSLTVPPAREGRGSLPSHGRCRLTWPRGSHRRVGLSAHARRRLAFDRAAQSRRHRSADAHLLRLHRILPRAARGRTFLNSLASTEKLFGFDPEGHRQGADAGLRGLRQRSATRCRELAHRAGGAAQLRVRDDRRQRPDEHHHEPRAGARGDDGPGDAAPTGCGGGCSAARCAGPGAAGVDPLLLPDHAAGGRAALVSTRASATFFDTWMAGGLGRAQSGYDEMVFRSMVKDGARFYDPLGLASEGTKIDFQLQINSYLYGTRFMVWLAGPLLARAGGRVDSRGAKAAAGYYASQFRKVFGTTIEQAWARWIADETAFQQKNLEAIRKFPVTPLHRPHDARARLGVARATTTRRPGRSTRPSTTRAWSRTSARSTETGAVDRLVDIKGPTVFTVTSLARDPAARDAVLHRRTTARGATSSRSTRPRGRRRCCRRTRASATWRSTGRTGRCGASGS